jgi:DNA-binding MarR family transcriptional regulator
MMYMQHMEPMKATEGSVMGDDLVNEISRSCLLTRTRRISRVLTGIYDHELRPFGINSPQFSLLVVIARLAAASRAEIGRANHQDRSTLTRNLQILLSAGWVEEVPHEAGGRSRSIVLTGAGRRLLQDAAPAWRAAQAKARDLLGADGVSAVTGVADDLLGSRPAA